MRCDPATMMLRVRENNGHHAEVSVFIGRNEGARANCGTITMRVDELREMSIDTARGFEIEGFEHPLANYHPTTGQPIVESAAVGLCKNCKSFRHRDGEEGMECAQSLGQPVAGSWKACSWCP